MDDVGFFLGGWGALAVFRLQYPAGGGVLPRSLERKCEERQGERGASAAAPHPTSQRVVLFFTLPLWASVKYPTCGHRPGMRPIPWEYN